MDKLERYRNLIKEQIRRYVDSFSDAAIIRSLPLDCLGRRWALSVAIPLEPEVVHQSVVGNRPTSHSLINSTDSLGKTCPVG